MGLAIHSLLALVALGLVFLAVSGRQPPKNEFADLMFPLQDGTYYVVAGGSIQLLNPHVATLRSERFREYRGQSYGIDIVKVNFLGMRASVVASRNPRKYAIFGDAIYAPCSGIVLDAEDKFRDMPPPEPDRKHMTGNYVLLNCGEYEVFLGHLQEGAVRVRPGDFIETGAVLGQVGNSGNTENLTCTSTHSDHPGMPVCSLGIRFRFASMVDSCLGIAG